LNQAGFNSSRRGGLLRTDAPAAIAAILAGLVIGFLLVHGSLKLQLLPAGVAFVAIGFFYPHLVLWLLVVLTAWFPETLYGVQNTSAFRLSSYVLDPFRLNIYELLIYALFIILIARRLIEPRRVKLPPSIVIPMLAFVAIFGFQFARALTGSATYREVMSFTSGRYALAGLAALWCFTQLLETRKVRLLMLDTLFAVATARAIYALFRYFAGGGDSADVYRTLGVKVALWESADHVLFVMLIVIAIAGWTLGRVGRLRSALWLPASALMAITIVLSFRRTGWLGLVAGLAVAALFLLGRSKRALVLVPAAVGAFVAVVAVSYRRFAGTGSLVHRLFPDLVAQQGPTRQDEWALAWSTISRNPLAGDMTARRASSLFADWDTSFVHNAFLFVWMKFGLLGLLALTSVIVACGRYIYRGVRARSSEDYVALGALSVAPFLLLVSASGTPLSEIRMVTVLAIAAGLGLSVGIRDTVDDAPVPGSSSHDGG
jgi:O-antigen ligase